MKPLPNLKDIGTVAGALVVLFALSLAHIRQDLSLYGLWPEFLKLAALCAFFGVGGVVFGYSLAWSRREDREA